MPLHLAIIVAFSIASMLLIPHFVKKSAEENAIYSAKLMANQFVLIRKYYTENVINKIISNDTIIIPHFNHKFMPRGIPLPASFILDIGELMGDTSIGLKFYSPYPFANRKDRSLDAFGKDAWAALNKNPQTPFAINNKIDGKYDDKYIVRVAVADIMADQACVDCHNSHPLSPKTDWKLGDLRGVLEISSDITTSVESGLLTGRLLALALLLVFGTITILSFRRSHGEFKNAEKILARQNKELDFQKHALDEHAAVSITDAKGNITYANDRFCNISGYAREELIGQNHKILKSGEHSAEFYKDLWSTISQGLTWHGEIKNKKKNGGYYWVKATIVPFMDERGKPIQYAAIRTDITSTKKFDELLRFNEERFRTMVENAGDAIYIHDRFGKIFDVNQVACDQTGYAKGELLLLSVAELDAAIDFENLRDIWDLGEADPNKYPMTMETAHRRKDGTTFPIEVRISLLPSEDGTLFIAMVRDITERKEVSHKLEQAKKDAETANQAKSDFLSSMSHELRTPLNAILGFTQLLEMDPRYPLNEAQKESTEHILKGGNHLLELINQVLELAKIEAGKMSLSIEPVSISNLLDESIPMVEPMAEKRNITINVNNEDCTDVAVMADLTRIKQVLLNLLSNAVKYNTQGGSISVNISKKDDAYVHIAVSDTGPGIPNDKQDGIFQPFNRLGHETSEIEGTGIGLVIAREMIHLMKGDIGFESEIGKGSTFWIEIPLAKQTSESTIEAIQAQVGEPEQYGTIGAKDTDYTVLYIEDNKANLQLMEKVLRMMSNINLITANDAELGLKMAAQQQPDIILLDINLPGMDGYEALERLKISELTSSIPVIAVTAQATKSEITRGRHAGFKGYVTKPIQVQVLIDAITETLKNV